MATAHLKRKRQKSSPPDPEAGNGDDDYPITIPPTATTLAGFRDWSYSESFPQRGKITFVGGEIIIDMSPERLTSHVLIKSEVYIVVGGLMRDEDLGRLYPDGARVVNVEADVSNEPDSMAVLWESFASGAVREIPTADGDDWIELEGTPDWILEIVSPSSVGKDTVKLRGRYHRAQVPEFWLIDVRGKMLDFSVLLWHSDGYRPAPSKGGWQKSQVFGKHFRLVRTTDRRGRRAFRLEMK
jgi:Uma2 family endonuclease